MGKDESTKIGGHEFDKLSNQVIGAAIKITKNSGQGFWRVFTKRH